MAAVGDARLAQLISILSSPSYRQFTLQRLEASTGQEAKFHRCARMLHHHIDSWSPAPCGCNRGGCFE